MCVLRAATASEPGVFLWSAFFGDTYQGPTLFLHVHSHSLRHRSLQTFGCSSEAKNLRKSYVNLLQQLLYKLPFFRDLCLDLLPVRNPQEARQLPELKEGKEVELSVETVSFL